MFDENVNGKESSVFIKKVSESLEVRNKIL